MSDILRISKANPIRMVITSWKNRNANNPDDLMFSAYSEPGFDSYFQPFLNTDTLVIQWDSSFDSLNTIELKNYLTDAQVSTASGVQQIDNTTYEVFQNTISLSGLDGVYYVEITGSDADAETYIIRSEPIDVRPTQCHTVLVSYYNNEVAFGIDYRSGVTFYMRIPAFFRRLADDNNVDTFTDSGGNRTLITGIINKQRILKMSKLVPQWVIEKINLCMLHDYCAFDSVQVVTEQTMPYDLISDRRLWGEPEVIVRLASGYNNYINTHDSGSRSSY